MAPTVGSIVHFKVRENIVRPAIVVHVFTPNCLQLQVFVDGGNDAGYEMGPNSAECATGLMWRIAVVRGDNIGQWQPQPGQGSPGSDAPEPTDTPPEESGPSTGPESVEQGEPGEAGAESKPEPAEA